MSTRTNSFRTDTQANYPAGHLHNLSVEQNRAFEEFKALIEQDPQCSGGNAVDPDLMPSYIDETLLRFLRARNFVPEDAFKQYSDTLKWREEQKLAEWYGSVDVEDYEQTRKLYTHWTGRRDRRSIPLYVFRIGALNLKSIQKYQYRISTFDADETLSPKLRRLFATYEHLTNFVLPLCSIMPDRPYQETPVSQTTCIVDISGVSLRQFWSLKNHLQDASALATAHYPETLGRTYIVGAPSFFPPIWKWLKGWFDPITVAKVFILSDAEMKKVLREQIEPRNLPKKYGGELKWEFGDEPILEDEMLDVLKIQEGQKTIPKGPIRWVQSSDEKSVEAHALGTIDGQPRDAIIGHIPREMFVK